MAATRLLAVAGVVLGISGATVIALAVTARTPTQQPPSAVSGGLVSEVSIVEPSPGSQPLPVEGKSFRALTAFTQVLEDPHGPVPLLSSEPASINIPAIGVLSEVRQVGLTAQHTLEVPAPGPHYNQAAWYKHSATPGAVGPAIIVGHVDSASDGPSVFFHLRKLRPGDEVLITRRDGTVAIFTVEAVGRYSKAEFPTELVYGDTDGAALRLITCGGTFDRAQRRYLDNVIVFATLFGSRPASSYPGGFATVNP